jgi:hypothetical protein
MFAKRARRWRVTHRIDVSGKGPFHMIRLTLILCASLYAGLVIYSQAGAPDPVDVPQPQIEAVLNPEMRRAADGTPMTLTMASGVVIAIDAVINPSEVTDDQVVQIGVGAPADEVTPVVLSESGPLLRVTGNSVNLRAGPSTRDAVLIALSRDTEAILLEDAANGWKFIRVVSSSVEGYMAGDFLTAVAIDQD